MEGKGGIAANYWTARASAGPLHASPILADLHAEVSEAGPYVAALQMPAVEVRGEGIHAKYCVEYVRIPVALLPVGANTTSLVQGRTGGTLPFEHVMYDYVNLEPPADPAGAVALRSPAQLPRSGQPVQR